MMKSMTRNVFANVLVGAVCTALLAPAAFAADVVIGVPNWPSVRVTAHILKVALEENLGLEVELQSGTEAVVFEAMDAGSMHVHPEVWLPNQASLHDKYVKTNKTVRMNPNGVDGIQATCTTGGTVERTGIKALADLSDPDMARNFDTDGDGKGEMWIGAAGWTSTTVEKIRAKSYGYDETMRLREMDEALALAEVDAAVASNRNIVFFCYAPHHIFALHDIVILKEPAHDPARWNVKQPADGADWFETSEAGVAWDTAHLHIHYAASLESSHPEAAKLLSNASFDTDALSRMSFAVVVEKQDPAVFAKDWVSKNGAVVDGWLK